MTNPMMDLRELAEKRADADLLRELIGFAADRLGKKSKPLVTLPAEIHCWSVDGATRFETLADHWRHVSNSGSAKAWPCEGGVLVGSHASPR